MLLFFVQPEHKKPKEREDRCCIGSNSSKKMSSRSRNPSETAKPIKPVLMLTVKVGISLTNEHAEAVSTPKNSVPV